MSPDTPESRIGRLERDHARLEQQVIDLANDVKELIPLSTALVRLEGRVEGVKNGVLTLGQNVNGIKRAMDTREQDVTDERRSVKVALIGLSAVIGAALIAAIATILATVL
jgi:hypothetical protein